MKIVQRSMFNVQRLFAVMLLVLPGVVFGEVVERIVAKVNNDIVTKTEWEDMVEARMAGKKSKSGKAEREKIGAHVLETMIADRLVVQAAVAKGLKVKTFGDPPTTAKEETAVVSLIGS